MKEEETSASLGRSSGEIEEYYGEKRDLNQLSGSISTSGLATTTIHIVQRRNHNEAPLSPSAYRSFHGQRIAASLDHTVAPSPPGEQHEIHHFRSNRVTYNDNTIVKDTKKKIRSIKMQLKHFEDNWEGFHGYRPNFEQKMKSTIAKPLLLELSKYRKILKELKEDARMGKNASFCTESFCKEVHMNDKKYFVGRPETIEDFSIDQLFQEKLDLQKSLLRYDTDYGPASKRDYKTFIKPVYDRCRTIRNIVAKIPKSKDSTDLQPILEHVAMDFSSPSPSHSLNNSFSTDPPDEIMDNLDHNNNNSNDSIANPMEKLEDGEKKDSLAKDIDSSSSSSSCTSDDRASPNVCYNLHALPFAKLVKELQQTLREKQELRQSIKAFEERQRAEGKKLDKETKSEFQSTYSLYKALKKKLRLLEALISKYEKQSETK